MDNIEEYLCKLCWLDQENKFNKAKGNIAISVRNKK